MRVWLQACVQPRLTLCLGEWETAMGRAGSLAQGLGSQVVGVRARWRTGGLGGPAWHHRACLCKKEVVRCGTGWLRPPARACPPVEVA